MPSGGILESLRYLGRTPGQTPYAGILEGLRKYGTPGLLEVPDYGWPQSSFAPPALASTPTASADGRRPIGDYSALEIADDLVKSGGVGLGRGAIQIAGLGGDIRDAISGGVQRAADYLAPGYAPNIGAKTSKYLASSLVPHLLRPLFAGPNSSQAQKAVESITGPFYQSKTVPGDYAQTVGEFLPGAMLVPEGSLAMRALRYGLVPALSSETAGQLSKGTDAEPWARFAATIVGGPGSLSDLKQAAAHVEAAAPSAPETPLSAAEQLAARRRAQLKANNAAGSDWETEAMGTVIPQTMSEARPQITVKSKGPSGLKVRVDAMGKDNLTGDNVAADMKGSQNAPLTPNQTMVYPEMEQYGGVVVGKGKAPHVRGTGLPPGPVRILRKPKS